MARPILLVKSPLSCMILSAFGRTSSSKKKNQLIQSPQLTLHRNALSRTKRKWQRITVQHVECQHLWHGLLLARLANRNKEMLLVITACPTSQKTTIKFQFSAFLSSVQQHACNSPTEGEDFLVADSGKVNPVPKSRVRSFAVTVGWL